MHESLPSSAWSLPSTTLAALHRSDFALSSSRATARWRVPFARDGKRFGIPWVSAAKSADLFPMFPITLQLAHATQSPRRKTCCPRTSDGYATLHELLAVIFQLPSPQLGSTKRYATCSPPAFLNLLLRAQRAWLCPRSGRRVESDVRGSLPRSGCLGAPQLGCFPPLAMAELPPRPEEPCCSAPARFRSFNGLENL